MSKFNTSNMIGIEVKHIKYGKGVVVSAEGAYVCIDFGNIGIKKFQYPDAFEKFLITDDNDINEQIALDLSLRKKEEDYLKQKESQEMYDNVKKFSERKAAEHEKKVKQQLEKQRQSRIMREQRMQNMAQKNNP